MLQLMSMLIFKIAEYKKKLKSTVDMMRNFVTNSPSFNRGTRRGQQPHQRITNTIRLNLQVVVATFGGLIKSLCFRQTDKKKNIIAVHKPTFVKKERERETIRRYNKITKLEQDT